MTVNIRNVCNQLVQELTEYKQLPPGASVDQVLSTCQEKLICKQMTVGQCASQARQSVQAWFYKESSESIVKKPHISLIEGERDRSTITDCDQKYINAEITEEDWKQKCFAPGTWNFQRRDQLIKQLEDRKKLEKQKQSIFNSLQVRIGPSISAGKTLYRDSFHAWNTAVDSGQMSSTIPNNTQLMPSNDLLIEKKGQFGANISITTGSGLARLTNKALVEATILDLHLYNTPLSLTVTDLEELNRVTLLKLDFYHSIFQYSFVNWGLGGMTSDPFWNFLSVAAPIHLGFAYQVLGTPVWESGANKTVLQHDDFFQNYLLVGAKLSLSFEGQNFLTYNNVDSQRLFCEKSPVNSNELCSTWEPAKSLFPVGKFGNQFFVSSYIRGEVQNYSSGLNFILQTDFYPNWDKIEASASLSGFVSKGHMRLTINGSTRKIWTNGNNIIGLPYSAYEYSLQFLIGYLIAAGGEEE